MNTGISVTLDTYKQLRTLYDDAVRDDVAIVKFEGKELLVSYLRYLLEYMETISAEIAGYSRKLKKVQK